MIPAPDGRPYRRSSVGNTPVNPVAGGDDRAAVKLDQMLPQSSDLIGNSRNCHHIVDEPLGEPKLWGNPPTLSKDRLGFLGTM